MSDFHQKQGPQPKTVHKRAPDNLILNESRPKQNLASDFSIVNSVGLRKSLSISGLDYHYVPPNYDYTITLYFTVSLQYDTEPNQNWLENVLGLK